jgi:hypothetical protein
LPDGLPRLNSELHHGTPLASGFVWIGTWGRDSSRLRSCTSGPSTGFFFVLNAGGSGHQRSHREKGYCELYAPTIGSFAEFAGGGVPRRKNAPKTLVEVPLDSKSRLIGRRRNARRLEVIS